VRAVPLFAAVLALGAAPGRADEAPAAPAAPAPRIAFDRESHDFGVVRQEQELKTEFRVKNEGAAPLHIRNVKADCGCAFAAVEPREIEPGGSAPLAVVFRTLTFSGRLTKRVRVWSDDPERAEAEVKVSVDVAAGVVLVPARFSFDDVLVGTSPSTSITARWREGAGRPFRVTSVEAPGVDLAFETEPFEAPPWHGTKVVARFRSPPRIGSLTGTVTLHTDHPDHPRLSAPVTGFVSGKVWVSLRAVRLGIVAAGKERAVPIVVRGFSPAVDLGEVKAVARRGRVEASAVRSGGRKGEWVVVVRSPAGAKPGKVDDVVEVRTAVEGEEVTEIPVSGEVKAVVR
jgi:hypothetical protein